MVPHTAFPATSLTAEGNKPLSQERDDSPLLIARIQNTTLQRDMQKDKVAMSPYMRCCQSSVTSPSIFLHSGSWIIIIIFSAFPEDQGCSVCQGNQCWGVCGACMSYYNMFTADSTSKWKEINLHAAKGATKLGGKLQNRHKLIHFLNFSWRFEFHHFSFTFLLLSVIIIWLIWRFLLLQIWIAVSVGLARHWICLWNPYRYSNTAVFM